MILSRTAAREQGSGQPLPSSTFCIPPPPVSTPRGTYADLRTIQVICVAGGDLLATFTSEGNLCQPIAKVFSLIFTLIRTIQNHNGCNLMT